MGSGIKFFDINLAANVFGGTAGASSNSTIALNAFDGSKSTFWCSSSENSDATTSYLQMTFLVTVSISRVYVYGTNAKTYALKYWNGASFSTITPTVTKKSSDGAYMYFEFTPVGTTIFRFEITQTLIANSEKVVYEIICTNELGQLQGYPDIKPTISYEQFKQKLLNGKYHVTNRGESFSCELTFRSYLNTSDIALIESLKDRNKEFYVLLCGANETQFTRNFKPFRLKDIYKVAIIDGYDTTYTGNYYKAGYNSTLKLVEVA